MSKAERAEQGSVLMVAVIGMLLLELVGISFALVAALETRNGLTHKAETQADTLAEAGLEHGRDLVRSAATEPCGFTRWTSAVTVAACGAARGPLLVDQATLAGGRYSVVIDNDCGPLVPAGIQDGECVGATPAKDGNDTAVLTAFATAGEGRARVRALLAIDGPWRHVCASSSQDNPPGYCNEAVGRNGNPQVTPGDPSDPSGPAAYDTLPRPELGCSAIDVRVHGENPGNCPPGQNYRYPYPTGKRLVVLGDRSRGDCDGGGQSYQGYFDCALTTPCEAPVCAPTRRACVRVGDARLADTTRYIDPGTGGCGTHTGMVFKTDLTLPADLGSPGNGRNVYILGGGLVIRGRDVHGAVVVEGGSASDCAGSRALLHGDRARIWASRANTTHGQPVYGYPLAFLVFTPQLPGPAPTALPLDPQPTCADLGGPGAEIRGLVYSGGHVRLGPIAVQGGVVAFEIQTESDATSLDYDPGMGSAAPPPGFPIEDGRRVVLLHKSVSACSTYADDRGGGTPCP